MSIKQMFGWLQSKGEGVVERDWEGKWVYKYTTAVFLASDL